MLDLPGVTVTETGLQIAEGTPFEVRDQVARQLAMAERDAELKHSRVHWHIGDLLNTGNEEEALQLASRFDPGTARNDQWVCRHVKDRRPALSFGHHQAVASLPAAAQSELLDMAEELHWTRSELREEVSRIRHAITPGLTRITNRLSYSLSYALGIKQLIDELNPDEREKLAGHIKKIAAIYESLL